MRMSQIMKAMEQVPENGLMSESAIKEKKQAKRLPGDGKSMSNHILAYNKMMGITEDTQTPQKPITEDTMKTAGALQVVKELLDEGFTKNPGETMSKIKEILKDF